jgi:hypothetical protein
MEVKKLNRNKWKEEMLDGIKKNGVYSIIYRGSSVLIVTVLVIVIVVLVKTRKPRRS